MKFSTMILGFLVYLTAFASSSECDLNFNYTNTGSNMTFALPNSSIESIEELGTGTLGAFFLNNQENLVCAGSTLINGMETAFPIMGDDLTTDDIDGYLINQELNLIFTTEYGTQYKLISSPSQGYEINGIYYVDSFSYEMIECGNEIFGCMDAEANNYNSDANIEDNSCIFDLAGCIDDGSCNYNEDALIDDGTCVYASSSVSYNVPVSPANWGGDLQDINNASITLLDESNDLGCSLIDFDLDGSIALIKRGECQFSLKALNAQNAGASAVIIFNNSPDILTMIGSGNYANEVHIPVYSMEGSYGAELASFIASTNESYTSHLQEHTLTITTTAIDCDGNCANDEDQDGICDELEIEGCIDSQACNFNPEASNNNSCVYPEEGYNCAGNCNEDSDNDGICDGDEGCLSLNYNYTNTGSNMTFALPNSSIESIEELGTGTLGAFFLNNQENLVCAGSTLINGMETAFPIMGDDLTTDDIDGYLINQELNLIFTTEYGTQYKLISSPSQGYEINGIYYVDSFSYEMIECGNEIFGCMDAEANNYNSDANIDDNSCAYDVYGCLDSEANNYNADANLNDNSCTYDIYGCLDSEANNYDSDANLDDNSCTYDIYGCLDSEANNYNSDANLDGNSCTYDIYGCLDSEANNYNSDANLDGNSCTYDIYGCLDIEANNYNADANLENNSCTYDIYGCLDSEANNYNADANLNDNSCIYEEMDCGCLDANYIEYYTQGYLAECDNGSCAIPVQSNGITNENFNTPLNTGSNSIIGFNLMNIYLPEGTVVGAFYDLNNDGQISETPSLNSMDGIYYECVGLSNYQNSFFTLAIWADDSFTTELDGVPIGVDNILLAFLLPDQTVVSFDISPETFLFTINGLIAVNTINLEIIINGCTNPAYCNYNNNAELDDGSCSGFYGCMEEIYVDYNLESSCHNQELCTDTWQDNLLEMEDAYEDVLASMDSAISANEYLSSALDNQTEITLDIENEMTNMVLSIEQANANIANLASQLSEAEANNDNLQIINDAIEQENSILNSLLDNANLTIIEMSNSMENLNTDNQEMQLGMASLENTMNEMNSMMDTLMIENETLTAPIDIDLISGWNIIGYTLRTAQDAVISFDNVIENISVVKNNTGEVYWPEFGFNGIGDLLPGQGYQVLTFDEHNGFNFENMDGLRRNIYPTIPQWAIDMESAVHPNDVRNLVRIVNTLGQEVVPENQSKGNILYYLFNDGSVEKKIN
ncbi:MAG: hypothetical protein QMB13_04755 [Flavobacteriales bacterium]